MKHDWSAWQEAVECKPVLFDLALNQVTNTLPSAPAPPRLPGPVSTPSGPPLAPSPPDYLRPGPAGRNAAPSRARPASLPAACAGH